MLYAGIHIDVSCSNILRFFLIDRLVETANTGLWFYLIDDKLIRHFGNYEYNAESPPG
jgi:hypothetical protein